MNRYILGVLLVAALMANGSAHAHGIWFAQRSGELALIYGEGGDDLDMVKRLPLVRHVTGFDASGLPVRTGLSAVGKLVIADLQEEPTMIAAMVDNGIWTKSADGRWHKKRRDQVPDAASSSHNFKYAIHLLKPLKQQIPNLPEHRLQITPLAGIPASMGQPLRLQVLYRGKPAAGVEVLPDLLNDPDGRPFVSGADGIVTIQVRNQGLNVIAARLVVSSDDPAATEKIEHLATLSFRLAHAPE